MLEVSRVPSWHLNQFRSEVGTLSEEMQRALPRTVSPQLDWLLRTMQEALDTRSKALYAFYDSTGLVGCAVYSLQGSLMYNKPALIEEVFFTTLEGMRVCTLGRKLEKALERTLEENSVSSAYWIIGSTTIPYRKLRAYALRLGMEEHGTHFIKTLKGL